MYNLMLKWNFIYGLTLSIVPILTWYKFLKTWAELHGKLRNRQLFHRCHNCVVMYAKQRGISGWPNQKLPLYKNFVRLDTYDPILYFINTAKKSLDIAIMLVDNTVLIQALIEAHNRSVSIRLLLDYNYSLKTDAVKLQKSGKLIKDVQQRGSEVVLLGVAGIDVLYYVCPKPNLCSILHYKFMLKDYTDGEGYAYLGSLNWSKCAIEKNYENTVFTSSHSVVSKIHENFENAWNIVNDICQSNYYVKAKLKGLQ